MPWHATQQVVEEHQRAVSQDPARHQAYADLEFRATANPHGEGLPLKGASSSKNPFMRRIAAELAKLGVVPARSARASYQTIDAAAGSSPSFAYLIHVPDWRPPDHLMLVLATVQKL